MKVYDAQSLRNVALVGHSGSGKTQLVSALLFDAGAVNRLGRVDEGTTVTDYDEEEIARKHTLSASLAYAEWNKHKINFIDTPGMANFLSDARAALRVVGRVRWWSSTPSPASRSRPRRSGRLPRSWACRGSSSSTDSIASARASTDRSNRCAASSAAPSSRFNCRSAKRRASTGSSIWWRMKAWTFATDGTGKATEGAVPDGLASAAQTARESLIEMVAEADDALMEKFFDAGTLSQEELLAGLKRGVAAGRIFPVVCASATANIGMQPILDAILAVRASAARTAARGARQRRRRGCRRSPLKRVPWPRSSGRPSPIRSPGASRCSA